MKQSAQYVHGMQHHNPIELFASTVQYEQKRRGKSYLTIYDKTQGVSNSLLYITQAFNLLPTQVRVISPYVVGRLGQG